jgi:hypothetical protein
MGDHHFVSGGNEVDEVLGSAMAVFDLIWDITGFFLP